MSFVDKFIERYPVVKFEDLQQINENIENAYVREIFNHVDKILNKPSEIGEPIDEFMHLLEMEEPGDEKLRSVSVFMKVYPVISIFIIPIAFKEEYRGNPSTIFAAMLSMPKLKSVLEKSISLLSSLTIGKSSAEKTIGLIVFAIVRANKELLSEVRYGRIKLDDALDLANIAIKGAELFGDKALRLDALFATAMLNFIGERYDKARETFEKILEEIDDSSFFRDQKLVVLIYLGQCYYYLKEYEKSLEYLNEAHKLYFTGDFPQKDLVFIEYYIGKALIERGEINKGLERIKNAMEIARNVDKSLERLIKDELKQIEKKK